MAVRGGEEYDQSAGQHDPGAADGRHRHRHHRPEQRSRWPSRSRESRARCGSGTRSRARAMPCSSSSPSAIGLSAPVSARSNSPPSSASFFNYTFAMLWITEYGERAGMKRYLADYDGIDRVRAARARQEEIELSRSSACSTLSLTAASDEMSAKKGSRKRDRSRLGACVEPRRRGDCGDHLRACRSRICARRREHLRVVRAIAAIVALADIGDLQHVGRRRIGRVDEAGEIEVVGNRGSRCPARAAPISSALWQQSLPGGAGAHRPVVVGEHVLEQGIAPGVGGVERRSSRSGRARGSRCVPLRFATSPKSSMK